MFERFNLMKEFPAVGSYATGFPVRAEGGFIYAICWVNNVLRGADGQVKRADGRLLREAIWGFYRLQSGRGDLLHKGRKGIEYCRQVQGFVRP
jgi:hypothetical protein